MHTEGREGELLIQLSAALREVERLQVALGDAFEDGRAADKRAFAADAALAAARRKQGELWELLREARLALVHWAETAEMPLLARIEAALAAPAAGRDPAIEDADAAWRDGEAHGRDK